MDRGGAGGSLDQGNASSSEAGLSSGTALTTLANVLDDGSFHSKLDKIEREEPDDVLKNWSTVFEGGEGEDDIPRPKRFRSNHRKWHGSW